MHGLRLAVLPLHEGLVGLVEGLLLGQHHMDMAIALAVIDLTDDVESDNFTVLDVARPVVEATPILGADDLIQNLVGHEVIFMSAEHRKKQMESEDISCAR